MDIPYKFIHCNKTFSFKTHLTRHVLVHTGKKSHKCKVCEKSFNRSEHLTKHIKKCNTKLKLGIPGQYFSSNFKVETEEGELSYILEEGEVFK